MKSIRASIATVVLGLVFFGAHQIAESLDGQTYRFEQRVEVAR